MRSTSMENVMPYTIPASAGLTLSRYDFALVPSLIAEDVLALADPAFVDNGGNALLIGTDGTGKTHLLTAIGKLAAQRGKTVLFLSLANHPGERLSQTLDFGDALRGDLPTVADSECLRRDLVECDLLLIDDFDEGKAFLIDLLKARFEAKRSTFIATHGTPADWISKGLLNPPDTDRFGRHHSMLHPTARSMAELQMGLFVDRHVPEMQPIVDRCSLPHDNERRAVMLAELGLFPLTGVKDAALFEWFNLKRPQPGRDWRILRITDGNVHARLR